MEIETTICIDTDDLANELEDQMREMAEEVVNNNDNGYMDEDDIQGMFDGLEILDEDDVQQLINDSMMDVADNTDTINEITTQYGDLRLECMDMRNEVEKLRRSMRVLLEERDSSLSQRVRRAYNAGHRSITNQINKIATRIERH